MKYAKFDEYGFPIAFYVPEIINPPSDAIEITDAQWMEFLDHPGLRIWDGKKVIEYAPPKPPVTPTDVDRERDRRIEAGFEFEGVLYQAREQDRENISGAATAALAAIVNGAKPGDYRWHGGDSDFVWIAADNTEHKMDAQTAFAFGQAAMQYKTRYIFAARALKDRDPIPDDFADDKYWP